MNDDNYLSLTHRDTPLTGPHFGKTAGKPDVSMKKLDRFILLFLCTQERPLGDVTGESFLVTRAASCADTCTGRLWFITAAAAAATKEGVV